MKLVIFFNYYLDKVCFTCNDLKYDESHHFKNV